MSERVSVCLCVWVLAHLLISFKNFSLYEELSDEFKEFKICEERVLCNESVIDCE